MSQQKLAPELEVRIAELEKEENQGGSFSTGDWIFLTLSGIAFPALLLIWGWV
jgi:hypothetical protein